MATTDFDSIQPLKPNMLRGAAPIFLVLSLLSFLTLGSWQVQRLSWKKELINRVETRIKADPVRPPSYLQWSESADPQSEYEYQHVTVTGKLLNDKEVPVYASTELGAGYWIMTPLETSDTIVWINRGYVPNEKRRADTRLDSLPVGEVTVVGLLRASEEKRMFVRENVPAENRWYYRNTTELTNGQHIDRSAPYFIDADGTANAGGWPKGGLTVLHFRNNHLSYALTWFGLALLNIFALVFFIRNEWSGVASRTGDAETD